MSNLKDMALQSNFNQAMAGQFGHDYITPAFGKTPNGIIYLEIIAMEDTTLNYVSDPIKSQELEDGTPYGGAQLTFTALLLEKGDSIMGRLKDIEVTGGKLKGYLR